LGKPKTKIGVDTSFRRYYYFQYKLLQLRQNNSIKC
jgi:hypothetical protein